MVLGNGNQSSSSLAGSWGADVRKKSMRIEKDPEAAQRYTTTTKSSFTSEPFRKSREVSEPSRFGKFVSVTLYNRNLDFILC
jgi:hypothetical protein